jgi:hypothetical protein
MIILDPSMDLQRIIAANPPGTNFVFTKGVFRNHRLQPKQDQKFFGTRGETILSGAITLAGWTAVGRYWAKQDMPGPKLRDRGLGKAPFTNDPADLWVDGVPYARVARMAQLRPRTWYFDTASLTAFLSDDPAGRHIVINNTVSCFEGEATGVVLHDLVIENYANHAEQPVIPGNPGWQVHNCVARHNHGMGIGVGRDGSIIGGKAIANGQLGVGGSGCHHARVTDLEIVGNNYAGYDFDWEAGGIKIVEAIGVEIRNCRVNRNRGVGIWADIDCSDWLCSGNEVVENEAAGILIEISRAARLIDNRVLRNGAGRQGFLRANIVLQNSRSCEVVNNEILVPGGGTGIALTFEERGSGPYGRRETRDNVVHRNRVRHCTIDGSNGIEAYREAAHARRWSNSWNHNSYFVPDGERTYWRFFGNDYSWDQLRRETAYEAQGTLEITGRTCIP